MNHRIVRSPVSPQTLSLLVSSEAFMFDLHYVDWSVVPPLPCLLFEVLSQLSFSNSKNPVAVWSGASPRAFRRILIMETDVNGRNVFRYPVLSSLGEPRLGLQEGET